MVFRISGKQIFLTYPKCPLERDTILERCSNVGTIARAIIVRETHEDGDFHLHAMIEYETKRNVTNPRAWDIIIDETTYHPNVQTIRNIFKSKNYLAKEDQEPLIVGNIEEWGKQAGAIDHWSLLQDMSEQDAINYAIKNRVQQWQFNAIRKHRADLTITEDPATGTINDPTLMDVELEEFKSAIIIGNTGAGKTTRAKALGPYPMLWVTHLDDLKHFVPGTHVSIIFDDMSFKHLPRQTQLHLLDEFEPRTIHIRYACVTIPAGVKRIFTCNFSEFPFLEGDHALERRYTLWEGDRNYVA